VIAVSFAFSNALGFAQLCLVFCCYLETPDPLHFLFRGGGVGRKASRFFHSTSSVVIQELDAPLGGL